MKPLFHWVLSIMLAAMTLFVATFALPWFFIHKRYGIRVLIGYDQLANTYASGYPDEMISARAWRSGWGFRRRFIDMLFFAVAGERDHCLTAYMSERTRVHLPDVYRNKS